MIDAALRQVQREGMELQCLSLGRLSLFSFRAQLFDSHDPVQDLQCPFPACRRGQSLGVEPGDDLGCGTAGRTQVADELQGLRIAFPMKILNPSDWLRNRWRRGGHHFLRGREAIERTVGVATTPDGVHCLLAIEWAGRSMDEIDDTLGVMPNLIERAGRNSGQRLRGISAQPRERFLLG